VNRRKQPNPILLSKISNLLEEFKERRIKKSNQYRELKKILRPQGFKPFDIFATYNYITGSTKGDWEGSIKLAAYVAQRRKVG